MDNIIHYLLNIIQYQHQQICWLIMFICKYIPLKQWAYEHSHSPEYQKFKVDEPPVIIKHEMFDYKELIDYFFVRYQKRIKPVSVRKNPKQNVPEDTFCPRCGAHNYLYDNNSGNGQFQCKVCYQTFKTGEQYKKPIRIKCPHCGNTLTIVKSRKVFNIHKCVNKKCPYYLSRKKILPKGLSSEEKYEFKLHYIYREFTLDFYAMDPYSLPGSATTFEFKKFNPHVLGLVICESFPCFPLEDSILHN